MDVAGNEARTSFEIEDEGQYYFAAVGGGEAVRISDDFFIRLAEDGKPELTFVKPGADYNASGSGEVLTRIDAKDDDGLWKVILHYSATSGQCEPVALR